MTDMVITIPTLRTERLILRAPRPEDFEPFAEFICSERAELERGRQTDRHGAWLHFSAATAQWVLRGYGAFSIEERATGAYCGECGVFHEHNYPEVEIGWMLTIGAEGRGFAREAALAVRGWAYRSLGLKTLVSYIDPANKRSITLAERLGAALDTRAPRPCPNDLVYRHPAPSPSPEALS